MNIGDFGLRPGAAVQGCRLKRVLALITPLLFSVLPCMAVGMKDDLTVNEYKYINNTFYPILINAHMYGSTR